MGKNSRRRHVDKQRRAAERRRRHHDTQRPRPRGPNADTADAEHPRSEHREPHVGRADACRQLEQLLGSVLRDRLWPNGWQPTELVREVGRNADDVAIEVLALAIVADVSHHDRVGTAVHDAWRRQTDRIAARCVHEPERSGWMERALDAVGPLGLSIVRELLDRLLALPGLPTLLAPPGSSGPIVVDLADLAASGAGVDSESDPKLATIRALLAKAEATEFPAEAEAFTAKAQAMMVEARLDEATVHATASHRSTRQVSAIRIGIDDPYVASKQMLLHVIAQANDVRCVFHRGVDLATLVGPAGQLAHVELLFTSLLIQVQTALTADAATAPPGSHVRSRRYRSSFIAGFAQRIGERLRTVRDATVTDAHPDALPVLAADRCATDELFDQLVGRTTTFRSSARYDVLGARAGASAAERAALRDAGLGGSRPGSSNELPGAG
jgi:hypothetical protein